MLNTWLELQLKKLPSGRESKKKKKKAGVFNGCYQSICKVFTGAINVQGKKLRGQRAGQTQNLLHNSYFSKFSPLIAVL